MSNITIFKKPSAVSVNGKRELSDLAKSLAGNNTSRRISTNTNGTFKRVVNGEQMGNAIRGEIDVIIVNTLPKVSRVFYEGKYDPNAKATLPDCWSNLGDRPEAAAENPQSKTCEACPKNVSGSGDNGGRACRFQRRLAVLLADDDSGEVYQFNVPAKSLFGKGIGNVHPFESYVKYLIGNGESPDSVVTNISYNLNADSMELLFTPLRNISDEEYELVTAAQASPDSRNAVMLTVAAADGATRKPEEAKRITEVAKPAKVVRSEEPEDMDEEPAPVKRASAKTQTPPPAKRDLASLVDQWDAE